MGTFVITRRTNNEFQFNLRANNGLVILTSEGYTAKAGCLNGIKSVRENSQLDARYARETAKDGRLYFNLKAGNGEIIGTSQMYQSESARETGITSVKNNAPGATVEDLS
ncbi:MAG: DUF1508 domain-containing protein [Flavobacterium sp.]|uniref:DUF1508 domain-containing protein n=1 Tax=Flavobacterium supellecticarium TaxID=2565924 RepID=A0A4V3W7I6_9FLAO|nr:YegP family protein [Flavobacterium supellecticarium]MPT35677.1 DUF1508 domain-containing protein [Flavobacterium sp.]THF47435.1 DUF1508 domain-containing protein [Flavobacterium supellecticarium]